MIYLLNKFKNFACDRFSIDNYSCRDHIINISVCARVLKEFSYLNLNAVKSKFPTNWQVLDYRILNEPEPCPLTYVNMSYLSEYILLAPLT